MAHYVKLLQNLMAQAPRVLRPGNLLANAVSSESFVFEKTDKGVMDSPYNGIAVRFKKDDTELFHKAISYIRNLGLHADIRGRGSKCFIIVDIDCHHLRSERHNGGGLGPNEAFLQGLLDEPGKFAKYFKAMSKLHDGVDLRGAVPLGQAALANSGKGTEIRPLVESPILVEELIRQATAGTLKRVEVPGYPPRKGVGID